MLRYFLLALCIGLLNKSYGQYSFSVADDNYNTLGVLSRELDPGTVWGLDDSLYYLPLGFSVMVDSVSYDSIRIDPAAASIEFYQACAFEGGPGILPLLVGLVDRGFYVGNSDVSKSPLKYKIKGSPGNRIFKLQWGNAAFSDGDFYDYINFQVWIHEGSNIIEVRFGPNSNPEDVWDINPDGPMVFFVYRIQCFPFLELRTIWVFGDKTAPESAITGDGDPAPPIVNITGVPANGTIYRFTPGLTALANIEQPGIDVACYPNPFSSTTTFFIPNDVKKPTLVIYDLMGKELRRLSNIPNQYTLHRGDLPNGLFFFSILEENIPLAKGKLLVF